MRLKIKTTQSFLGGYEAKVRIRDAYGTRYDVPNDCLITVTPVSELKKHNAAFCGNCHHIVNQAAYCSVCGERLPGEHDLYAVKTFDGSPNFSTILQILNLIVFAADIVMIPAAIIWASPWIAFSLIATGVALLLQLILLID